MGDRIEIEAIEFIGNINMYQVDLYNATKDEHFRVFIPEKDIEQAKDDAFEAKTFDDIETTLSALCGVTVHTATYKCEDTPLITIDSQGNMKMFYKGEVNECKENQ